MTYANAPGPNGQSDGSVHKLRTANGQWTDVTPVKPGGTATGGTSRSWGSRRSSEPESGGEAEGGGGPTDAFGYGGVAVDARRPGTLVVSTNNRWAEIDTVFRSACSTGSPSDARPE